MSDAQTDVKEKKQRKPRFPRSFPSQSLPRRAEKRKSEVPNKRKLRESITPGTILILLAGAHRGKRVIFLKQLESGLLLVTGPFFLNGCPMRRVDQAYVISTQTKVDIGGVSVPEHVDDTYFRRKKLKKPQRGEGDIFDTKQEKYRASKRRKQDQVTVDKQVMDSMMKHPDGKMLRKYMRTLFSLRKGQHPHHLVF